MTSRKLDRLVVERDVPSCTSKPAACPCNGQLAPDAALAAIKGVRLPSYGVVEDLVTVEQILGYGAFLRLYSLYIRPD